MKKIYLSLSILLMGSQVSMAQLTLTKAFNEPVIGDKNYMKQYDSVGVIPQNTGIGLSWNFSTLTPNTFTETTTYTTVASSPSASAFPLATMASSRGNQWEMWKASSSMLEYAGQANPSSSDLVVFSNLGTWINWPVSFGSNNSDSFVASQTTGTNSGSWNGTISYAATGSGTVTLPGGNIHTNCLQLKKIIALTITSGTNTSQINMINCEYWSSSSKFPILTVEYQTVISGTNTSKNAEVMVNTSALTVGVNELQVSADNIIVYPNPANDFVNVLLPNNAIADNLEIVDVTGKVVARTTNSNSINLAEITKGVYYVRISNKEFTLQKPIVLID